ncbi:Uncharacterised protein [uncultured archaeon]|nr:Uncharacterised protein [uncultured archaeon]
MRTRRHPAHAQGSSEYLVLMSVILVLALIAIALLAMVPDASFDLRSSLSDSYWQGRATPLFITDHAFFSNGTLALMFVNTQPSTVRLYRVDLAGPAGRFVSVRPNLTIGGGSEGVAVIDTGDTSCKPFEAYEIPVNLTYSDTVSGVFTKPEFGEMPLVGRCR